MEIFAFKLNFSEITKDLDRSFSDILEACEEIKNNASLPKIIEVVLAIGNFCNYKPKKSATSGFKIDFLSKVNDYIF